MNGIQLNPFRNDERRYNLMKSFAEERLQKEIESGTVKVGSDEWRRQCEVIEHLDEMANRYSVAYDENN